MDETRKVAKAPSWRDPRELFEVAAHQYRRNRWSEQPRRVEAWSEKGTVRGTLAPVLIRYGVPFRVMHGFASATVANDIAKLSIVESRPFTALYVGDRDPSGIWMSEVDLPQRIARYSGKVDIARIAISETDTESRDVPSFNVDTKTRDARYNWYAKHYGSRCWELDALSPTILRDRVDLGIKSLIDDALWQRADQIEATERESLRAYIAGMSSNFRQVANCADSGGRP